MFVSQQAIFHIIRHGADSPSENERSGSFLTNSNQAYKMIAVGEDGPVYEVVDQVPGPTSVNENAAQYYNVIPAHPVPSSKEEKDVGDRTDS